MGSPGASGQAASPRPPPCLGCRRSGVSEHRMAGVKKAPSKRKPDPFNFGDPQVACPVAHQSTGQKKNGLGLKKLRGVLGERLVSGACSFPHSSPWVQDKPCRGWGGREGVLLLADPSPAPSGLLLAERNFPGSGHFLLQFHLASSRTQPGWDRSVLQRRGEKKSFSPPPAALPPAHASPPARSAPAPANVSKHPDGKAR